MWEKRSLTVSHQQLFDLLGQFHLSASQSFFLATVYHLWDILFFVNPLKISAKA